VNRETATIGHRGLYCETTCAVLPVVVITTIAAALDFIDAFTAAIAIVVVISVGEGVFKLSSMNTF